MLHFFLYFLLAIVVVLASTPMYLRLRNGPAYNQPPDKVVIREPGEPFLGPPEDIAKEGAEDLPFAFLSQVAYEGKSDAKTPEDDCILDANATLRKIGWVPWDGFPDATLQGKINKVHLRVEVWSNSSQNRVAVAFGGTVFTNPKDWEANLRWFIPHHDDEYTAIIKNFRDAFVTEYLRKEQQPEYKFLRRAQLYSTGHSLGGGLAQEFAYALPRNADVPRVTKVFAFDPSPVTGFYSVKKDLREYNAKNLAIDRIYERKEVLAILRSFMNFVIRPSIAEPVVRQIRYNLFTKWNIIYDHSIARLACKLYKACPECLKSEQAPPVSISRTAGSDLRREE